MSKELLHTRPSLPTIQQNSTALETTTTTTTTTKIPKTGQKFPEKTLTETAETDDDEVQSKNENRRDGEDRREIKERARRCASAQCDSGCSEEHKEQES
jgi:hypothetical protein